MNQLPPQQDPPDELDEQYRRLSAADSARPSEALRHSILTHAQDLAAAQRRTAAAPNARPRRWRGTIFGLLAAAALAGVMVAPRYLGHLANPVATTALEEAPRVVTHVAPLAPAVPETAPSKVATDARAAAAPPVTLSHSAGYAARHDQSTQAMSAAPRVSAPAAGFSAPAAAPALRPAVIAQSVVRSQPQPAAETGSALRQAAQGGDLTTLQGLLSQHPALNAGDPQGRTALMLATLNRQTAAVQALLAAGADPNAADARGVTPLQAATAADNAAIVAALQQYGAH